MSAINPARLALRRQASAALRKTWRDREQANTFRWSLTLYPTEAYAQDAEMSLSEFEEFVFDACFLNDPDPIARWQEISAQQQRLVDWLKGHRAAHIKGKGTDLTLSIKDRVFIIAMANATFPAANSSPFDEKLGVTVHLALGASYPETGGLNSSALHWDMVCDLRQTGEVWVDDVLFLKNGTLLIEA